MFRLPAVLCDLQGFHYPEIAEILGVPTGTVRSRLSLGRLLLQKALWEQAKDRGLTPVPDLPAIKPNDEAP